MLANSRVNKFRSWVSASRAVPLALLLVVSQLARPGLWLASV
jgi:hypothetical protein